MKLLEDRIRAEGEYLPGGIVRVDSFLNHQLDPMLMHQMGKEFARLFKGERPTKILTVEASGIAIAVMAGLELGVPVLFAKKASSKNLGDDQVYAAKARSFTKGTECELRVSAKYLSASDRILIIDDFLAMGEAAAALMEICGQAGAYLCGIGIAVEKGFQAGGERLRKAGARVEALAVLQLDEQGNIVL